MRLRYRIGETLRTVTIERSGEEYRATTGERTFHVAVARTDGPRLDLVIDGRSVTVFIAAAGDRRIVKLGAAEPITLERVAAREGRARAPIPGEDTVTAVMEGVVTAVAAREGETVADLLDSLGLLPEGVAVERNRDIIGRSDYSTIRLAEGDRIEIVHFVGGG